MSVEEDSAGFCLCSDEDRNRNGFDGVEVDDEHFRFCRKCGLEWPDEFVQSELIEEPAPSQFDNEVVELPAIFMTSLNTVHGKTVVEDFGLIYSTDSTMALGLNRNARRLEIISAKVLLGLESKARNLGANAIVAISMTLNSSSGSSSAFGGASEGVLAYGTAVKLRDSE